MVAFYYLLNTQYKEYHSVGKSSFSGVNVCTKFYFNLSYQDSSLKSTNVNLIVPQGEKSVDHGQYVCTKWLGNLSNSYWDINVWDKVVDRTTDQHRHAVHSKAPITLSVSA